MVASILRQSGIGAVSGVDLETVIKAASVAASEAVTQALLAAGVIVAPNGAGEKTAPDTTKPVKRGSSPQEASGEKTGKTKGKGESSD